MKVKIQYSKAQRNTLRAFSEFSAMLTFPGRSLIVL
ncbi:hypothetical protein B6N60_02752 [Richelia sinica FACHB-800]|uniref:Uncharacterized protein n=1 Tax=Richelia sinica FACHB-800 TaxID=1357546 RepID=A0A975T8H2_9NOST|nr:hypothetical protein B6N60_02752 [Richelia sinica FACHB-800]